MMVEHGSPAGVAPAGGGADKFQTIVKGSFSSDRVNAWMSFSHVSGNVGNTLHNDAYGFPTSFRSYTPHFTIAPFNMKLVHIELETGAFGSTTATDLSFKVMKAKQVSGQAIPDDIATVDSFDFNYDGYIARFDRVTESDVIINKGDMVAYGILNKLDVGTLKLYGVYIRFTFEEVV